MLVGDGGTPRRTRDRDFEGSELGNFLGDIAGGVISNGDILLRGTGKVAGSIARGIGNLLDGS